MTNNKSLIFTLLRWKSRSLDLSSELFWHTNTTVRAHTSIVSVNSATQIKTFRLPDDEGHAAQNNWLFSKPTPGCPSFLISIQCPPAFFAFATGWRCLATLQREHYQHGSRAPSRPRTSFRDVNQPTPPHLCEQRQGWGPWIATELTLRSHVLEKHTQFGALTHTHTHTQTAHFHISAAFVQCERRRIVLHFSNSFEDVKKKNANNHFKDIVPRLYFFFLSWALVK